MPKIDNMLAILWMLRSGEKITAKQISEKLEINIRTVYRYIDTISTSGVPIISEPGHNGGYTLLNNFIEAPLFFDFEEQTSLYHAAVFAEEAGYYGGEALNRAISKLSKYSNQEQETKINQHLTSLEVISRLSSLSIETFLKELEQAVADGYSVKILYYTNQAVFLLDKDMIHKYVPYLLLPYNKSIKVIEPISLKNRIIEVLSELIKFHQV